MIIGIIPAKGGSTRLPNKNMIDLLGKPLLYYAIDFARKSTKISDIYITTDSQNKKDYSLDQGMKVINRPKS
jgi:CMP-N-acetylneuraminic acid synthetase